MAAAQPETAVIPDYEALARSQYNLDLSWTLESCATEVSVGLDEEIERLEEDRELCDSERWHELIDLEPNTAWLPRGIILVTMRQGSGKRPPTRSMFIRVPDSDPQ